MTDRDVLELRRMVENDPVHPTGPDLAALIRSGRRLRARRRALAGSAAVAAAAAVAVPLLVLTGGPGPDSGSGRAGDVAASRPAEVDAGRPGCGVFSCVRPARDEVETGTVLDELSLGPLSDGAEELLYLVRTEGANDSGTLIDVLKAGYRHDGTVYGTVWALQPSEPGQAPHFWYNAGPVNARQGTGDHYGVLGYVDGAPDEITWSTPEGETGEVDGTLALDGYTAFYLTQPLPEGYEPPRSVSSEDGVHSIVPGSKLSPNLTIRTSDGWSCTLRKCGSTG